MMGGISLTHIRGRGYFVVTGVCVFEKESKCVDLNVIDFGASRLWLFPSAKLSFVGIETCNELLAHTSKCIDMHTNRLFVFTNKE